MKKIVLFLSLITGPHAAFAQNKYVDSLKGMLNTTTMPNERFDFLNKIQMDWWYSGAGMIDSSNVVQMFNLALQLNNDSLKAISYNWIGEYYQWTEDDYSKALDYYLKAVPLADKTYSKSWLSFVYSDISFLFWNLHNSTEEQNYARKAGASLPDKSDAMYNFVLEKYYTALGFSFIEIHKPDSALHYYQALTELNLKAKNPFYESAAMDGFAGVYAQLGDTALSDTYRQKAIKLCEQSGDIYDGIRYKKAFANSLLQQKRFEEAKQVASQGFAISKQNNYKKPILDLAKILKKIYTVEKKTDSAFYYSQIESDMKDSLLSEQKMNAIHAMAFSEQVRSMEEKAKMDREQQDQKENIQYALIALGIVTFLILFLSLSRSFITNEKVIEFLGVFALLIVFEFLNLVLHPLFDRITNHTPLLTLLGLVGVGAILVPMHHRIENWATRRLIEKNKQIRLAAAKKTIEELEKDKK